MKKLFIAVLTFLLFTSIIAGGIAADQKPVLKNQIVLFQNLLHFVPESIDSIKKKDIKNLAVKEITTAGDFTINDRIFESLMIETLVRENNFTVVERKALDYIIEEQKLSLTGLIEDEIEIGELLNVDAYLMVTLRAIRNNFLQADIMVKKIETGEIVWKDSFKGEYYTDDKLAVGPIFRPPFTYTTTGQFDGGEHLSAVSMDVETGPIFGLQLYGGQQLPGNLSFLELSYLSAACFDFATRKGDFSSETTKETVTSEYDEDLEELVPFTEKKKFKSYYVDYFSPSGYFLVKLHPAEWFNLQNDFFRIGAGFGFSVNMYGYNQKRWQKGENDDEWEYLGEEYLFTTVISPELIATVEFLPLRALSIYGDCRFRINERDADINGSYSVEDIDRFQFTIGVMYYFMK